MLNLKLLVLTLLVILLAGCPGGPISDHGDDDSTTPKPNGNNDQDLDNLSDYAKAIETKLVSAGVSVTEVNVKENAIEVSYSQPASEEFEEIYATWAYVFGVSVQNAPVGDALNKEVRTVSIVCSFDDGEKMKITSGFKEILAFLNEETSTWNFIYSLEIESLTKGPQIPE